MMARHPTLLIMIGSSVDHRICLENSVLDSFEFRRFGEVLEMMEISWKYICMDTSFMFSQPELQDDARIDVEVAKVQDILIL